MIYMNSSKWSTFFKKEEKKRKRIEGKGEEIRGEKRERRERLWTNSVSLWQQVQTVFSVWFPPGKMLPYGAIGKLLLWFTVGGALSGGLAKLSRLWGPETITVDLDQEDCSLLHSISCSGAPWVPGSAHRTLWGCLWVLPLLTWSVPLFPEV